MKKLYFISVLALLCTLAHGQNVTTFYDDSSECDSMVKKYMSIIDATNVVTKGVFIPKLDITQLKQHDKEKEGKNVPFRFGKGLDYHLTLSDGNWVEMDDGRLWHLKFEANEALSLNFVFRNFHLPDGGKLYVVNHNNTIVYGPITSQTIGNGSFFLTDVIPDPIVTILLYEPTAYLGKSSLTISKVVYGYRYTMMNRYGGLVGSSESCNNDVACFSDFQEEVKSVALVLLASGEELCSGALVMS